MDTNRQGQIAGGSDLAEPSQTPPEQLWNNAPDVPDLLQPDRCIESISAEQLNPDLVRKLPLEFLKSQCAIPVVLENGLLAVALAEPLNLGIRCNCECS